MAEPEAIPGKGGPSRSSFAEPPQRGALREVVLVFLRLGFTAFGGPVAHIAMMRDEVVRRRKWVSDQEFLDFIGATNLIPGPNSTEMAIHLGFIRAGWRGLIAGGVCFIVPAMLMVLALAWAYVQFGSTPQGTSVLYGVKPVIIAVVLQALWGLLRTAIKGHLEVVVALGALGLYLLGGNEIALLFGGVAVVALAHAARSARFRFSPTHSLVPLGGASVPLLVQGVAGAAVPFSQAGLFLTFLKIGAVLYGSGYVLLAFLRNDFVERLGWLTNQQLLDAVAIGQFTPGPVFTTATFIGYLVGGVAGAVLATIGIFLPGFVFVAAVNPLVPRLRRSTLMGALLDGVNAAALGLMAAVTLELARVAVVDPITIVLFLGAAVLLVRFRINSAWLVLGGGGVGLLATALGVAP